MLVHDPHYPGANLGQCIIPRDLLPFVFSPSSNPFQGVIEPSRMMDIFNDMSAARTSFGNGIGRLCAWECFVRLHRDEPVTIHSGGQPARIVTLHTNDFLDVHEPASMASGTLLIRWLVVHGVVQDQAGFLEISYQYSLSTTRC
jgi:hypothetical protein